LRRVEVEARARLGNKGERKRRPKERDLRIGE
jgi:hypothetical protein